MGGFNAHRNLGPVFVSMRPVSFPRGGLAKGRPMSDKDKAFNARKLSQLPPSGPRKLAYTFEEARSLLSVGQSTWTKLISSGQIRPIRGHRLVSLEELERYIRIATKPHSYRRGKYVDKKPRRLDESEK